MTKFMVDLDLHDARALLDCVGAGSIEGQITPDQPCEANGIPSFINREHRT